MKWDFSPDPLTHNRLARLSGYFMGAIITIALLALAGWQWNIALFKRPIPGVAAMNPMTALSFLLCAFSYYLLTAPFGKAESLQRLSKRGHLQRLSKRDHLLLRLSKWGHLLAAMVLCIALLRIANSLFPAGWQIDCLLYPDRLLTEQTSKLANRMAINTAFYFILSTCALFLLQAESGKKRRLSQFLAVLVILLSLFSLIGYLYRVQEFYLTLSYIPMAVHTAGCFLLLSLALLFTHPRLGFMQDVTGPLTGGVMARSLIPFAILVPLILGLLRLYGQWYHLFSVEFGVAVLVTSIIFFFLALIWHNMILLNKRDLASQKIAQELQASEQTFSLLVNSISDYAIFLVDPDGRIVSWNNGAQAIKGYLADEILGRSIATFYPKEEQDRGIPAYNLEMAKQYGHYQSESWRIRKDGSRFWADVTFTALYDKTGDLKGFAKITRDMTERKSTQEKIAYQARLIEDVSDAIISTDPSYRIITWNKAAETLYGFTASEAIGGLFDNVVRSSLSEEIRSAIRQELSQQGYWKGEIVYFNKKDQPLTISISVSGTRDNQGELSGYLLACRDITERVKAETQLRSFNEDLSAQVKDKTAELTGIFERVSDGFMAFDKKGTITYANRKAAEMNKRQPEDLVGKNFFLEFPSATSNVFGINFFGSIDRQTNIHFEMFSPSLQLWIECYMYPSTSGLSLFFRDISDQVKTQEMLIESNIELRELASHLQDIREGERATMAREIHDELGQQLTGIKMDLSWIAKKAASHTPAQIVQKAKDTLGLLDNTIQTVRRIATELRPSILDDLGLIAAIEWQSQEFEKRSGITTIFRPSLPEMDFPPDMAIGLFRICQESLTNVARHANATNVLLELDCLDDRVILTIHDDGIGLNPEKTGQKKTLGLLGMKERAIMMGGELRIDDKQKNGFTLIVNIPLQMSANF